MSGPEIVKAWRKWLASEEGQRCTEGVTRGVYLQNRLEVAFIAGSTAAPKRLSVEVRQHDWIPGFAAYLGGSVLEGPAHVVLNVGAFMASVEAGDLEAGDVPYLVAESLMHEVMHALEDWAGVEFSEDRVEALLTKYREAPQGEERTAP